MTDLVVDADVALKWHLPQHDAHLAKAVARDYANLHAPEMQFLEVQNILAKYVRMRQLSESNAREAASAHGALIAVWHDHGALTGPAFDLALRYSHPFYDCLYLALAVRLNARVVTADKAFASKFAVGDHAGRVILLGELFR